MEREQLSWQERGQLWLRLIIRLVLAAAAVVLVAKLGPPLLSLFAPFVAALIVAALLNPAVRWLQRRLGWSRKLLSLLLVVVIFGVIGGCLGILTYAAANELVSLAQNWSGMLTQVEGFFDQMEALFARAMDLLPLSVVGTVEDTVNALIQRLQAVDPTALLSAAKAATDWAMRVPEFLLALVVFVMASYFLTADYPYHRTRAVPAPRREPAPLPPAGEGHRPGRLRRLPAGGAAAVGGGVLHSAGGIPAGGAELRPAAGPGAGHSGLYPHHRVGHRYGALGGGGPVYPGFLHRCLSDGDLGGGGPCSAGWRSHGSWATRPACPLSCPWWASTWA